MTSTERLAAVQSAIEAAMAAHASIKPRGFDSNRKRAELRAKIEVMYQYYDFLASWGDDGVGQNPANQPQVPQP